MSDDATAKLRSLRKEPSAFRRVAVRSTEMLSKRMRRVVLGGDELSGFAIESPASSVRLLLPPPGHDEIVMPTWSGNQFDLPDGSRAPIRTFTPRSFNAERLELTLDMVLHASGLAADWARAALVGAEVAISGPGRSEDLDETAESFLIAGDESAIPAIGQLLEWIHPDRSVEVHVEVHDSDGRIEFPQHQNATVTWHEAARDAAPGDAMVNAVMGVAELADVVWVAGEAAAVQRLRKHLFNERGRDRSSVTARGYWKVDRAES